MNIDERKEMIRQTIRIIKELIEDSAESKTELEEILFRLEGLL